MAARKPDAGEDFDYAELVTGVSSRKPVLIPKPPAEPTSPERVRTKRDRINRLRERVAQARSSHTTGLANVLLGILDLMEDEL